jgi:hypothetical protein
MWRGIGTLRGDRLRPVPGMLYAAARRAVGLPPEGRGESCRPATARPPATLAASVRSPRPFCSPSIAHARSRCPCPGRQARRTEGAPLIMVWRSVRAGGETKTRKSRRTLKLPQRCVEVLRDHQALQDEIRQAAGSRWQDNDLVFPSRAGTPADASHVRRSFRKVVAAAGLDPHEWTPRELRHSFVSLLSDARFRSSRSPAWSATAAQPRQRRCTGSKSARWSYTVPMSWTASSRATTLSYSAPAQSRAHVGRMPSELVGVAGFEPAASSSRTARARVQVGCSEVSILLRALQAVRLTASKRTGPRAVAPISLPESDTPANRQGTESASGLPELDYARQRGVGR